jgi:hypothetical protein
MKPSDISIPQVGQYWLLPGNNNKPSLIIEITDNQVLFDDDWRFVLPLGKDLIHLWHIRELYITNFGDVTPKPGQIWVSDLSQEVFFIHPNQADCGEYMTRVISNSSNISGSTSLFSSSDKVGQDISTQ